MRVDSRTFLKEGLLGGLFAYLVVVLVLALLGLLQGESPFQSAAAMGAVVFHGAEAADHVELAAQPVLVYNLLHLLASLVVGFLAAFQLLETERHRSVWYLGLTLAIAATLYSVLFLGIVGVEIGGVMSWSTVVVATAAWIGAFALYFGRAHRGLGGRIEAEMRTEG